jgi:hypothetical protein
MTNMLVGQGYVCLCTWKSGIYVYYGLMIQYKYDVTKIKGHLVD